MISAINFAFVNRLSNSTPIFLPSFSNSAFVFFSKPFVSIFLTSFVNTKGVEKKNPLVLPPVYGELPIPKNNQVNKKLENENDIKVLLTNDNISLDNKIIKNSKPSTLEKSIIEKVR